MISKDFLESLNLPPDKAAELQAALSKEDFYRSVLYRAGVSPQTIPAIMNVTDTGSIDETKAELYIERARVEWKDFIIKPQKGR